jgi:hypothetical protein
MRSQWKEFLQYVKTRGASLSMDEEARKEETAYEEMKQRLYALHLESKNLFYVDNAEITKQSVEITRPGAEVTKQNAEITKQSADTESTEKETGSLTGEPAKGTFSSGDQVLLLDQSGIPLMEAQIVEKKEEEAEAKGFTKTSKKITLYLSWKAGEQTKEQFLQAQFVKK